MPDDGHDGETIPALSGARRCVATTRNGPNKGRRCGKPALVGATCCNLHLRGKKPRAHAAIRAELIQWTDGDHLEDPETVLLRLLSQAWRRVQRLGAALDAAIDAAGGDLAAAMVGDAWTVTPDGDRVKVGEYVRGLAQLEADERDRAANFSKLAIAAGIAQRRVAVAEQQAELAERALLAALADAGLPAAQQTAVAGRMAHHLQLLESAG